MSSGDFSSQQNGDKKPAPFQFGQIPSAGTAGDKPGNPPQPSPFTSIFGANAGKPAPFAATSSAGAPSLFPGPGAAGVTSSAGAPSLFPGPGAAGVATSSSSQQPPAPAEKKASFSFTAQSTAAPPAASPFSFSALSAGAPVQANASLTGSMPPSLLPNKTSLQGPASAQAKSFLVEVPTHLKNKTLGQIVGEWESEAEAQSKEYKILAESTAELDKRVLQNEQKLARLKDEAAKTLDEQNELEYGLKQISSQQEQLEKILDGIEAELEEVSKKHSGRQAHGPDYERGQSYRKISEIQKQIEAFSEMLGKTAAALSSANGPSEDPLAEVVRVLDSQLTTLQAADGLLDTLKEEVADLKEKNTLRQQKH